VTGHRHTRSLHSLLALTALLLALPACPHCFVRASPHADLLESAFLHECGEALSSKQRHLTHPQRPMCAYTLTHTQCTNTNTDDAVRPGARDCALSAAGTSTTVSAQAAVKLPCAGAIKSMGSTKPLCAQACTCTIAHQAGYTKRRTPTHNVR
jgi:hypothetical protein